MTDDPKKPIEELITALTGLPGIGPRSAQRLVFHLLGGNRELGHRIRDAMTDVLRDVCECSVCRNYATQNICPVCDDAERDKEICIVESPADLNAVEQSGGYRGYYFVLHGKLSPMEGMGPDNLRLDKLGEAIRRAKSREVILATNLTVEGEITAQYIKEFLTSFNLRLTRIAHGVPTGGELEYVDAGTLARALSGRGGFDERKTLKESVNVNHADKKLGGGFAPNKTPDEEQSESNDLSVQDSAVQKHGPKFGPKLGPKFENE